MFRLYLLLLIIGGMLLCGCDTKTKEELLQEGVEHSEKGNHRGAIVLFKNALEKDPNYLEARTRLGDVYLESGQFQNAENEYKKVLLQNPSDRQIVLKLAKVYIHSGDSGQAIRLLDESIGKDTDDIDALEAYGQAYLSSKDLQAAQKIFLKGLSIDAVNSKLKLGLARVYFLQERLGETRTLLNQIINHDAQNVAARYFLAELEAADGHADAAIKLYLELIEIDSEDLIARYRAGLLSLFANDIQQAKAQAAGISGIVPVSAEGSRLQGFISYVERDYEAAAVKFLDSLKVQPHAQSYFYLGLSYYALDQFEQALSQFQRALDLAPDFVKARNFSALTLLKQERLDDAINEAHKALSQDQNNAFAHQILGSAYLKQKKFDRGMAELETATRLNPDLVGAQLQKGMVRIAQGDVELGEEDLIQALQMSPDTQDIRLLLVNHYLKQQNYSEAVRTLKEGLTGEAVDGLLYNVLAGAYFAQGKKEQALAALMKAKFANPVYFTPYFNLASYYSASGDYESARREYFAILEQDPQQSKALLGLASLSGIMGEKDQLRQYLARAQETGTEAGFRAYASYLASQEEFVASLQIVQKGLLAYPTSSVLLELQGRLHGRLGHVDEAEAAFARLAEVDPERGTSMLIRFYLQGKMPGKAIDVANQRIQSSPDSSTGYLLLASIQSLQQETAAAFSTLEKGLGQVKDHERLRMRLAALHEQAGETGRAEKIYEELISEQPEYVPARFARAAIFHRQGNMKLAQDHYREVLQIDPSHLPTLNNMAYLLTDNYGRSQEALDLALKAYRQGATDPYVMDTLGYVLIVNGKAADAVAVLKRAVELVPENPTIALHLGMAYAQEGEVDEARPLLDKVIRTGTPQEKEQAEKILQGN